MDASTSHPATVVDQPLEAEPEPDGRRSSLRSVRSVPGVSSLLTRSPWSDGALAVALTAALAFLWGRAFGSWFWEDEGIAVGISAHRLGDLHQLLRQDGSPPLYYVLLHGWMSVFGSSDAATHVLSLVFALAAVPAALWVGWSLFGRRTGWMCALVAAVNPFLAYFATETRMYSLVALLSILATGAFLHAFVFRRRGYGVMFAAILIVFMYTHNWGLLYALGAGIALVPCLLYAPDRGRLFRDALLTFGAVALAYAPWLPTLVYQWGQHLQPWALPPTLADVRDTLVLVVGGVGVVAALGLGAGLGLSAVLRRPWSRTAVAVVATAAILGVVLVGGWRTVLTFRYMGAVIGPLLVVVGLGLAHAGRAGVAALAVAAFLAGPIGVKGPPYQKSNAKAVAVAASSKMGRGDLVLSPNFELVPLIAHYLPAGLRYATVDGPVADPGLVDWRNSVARFRRSEPALTVPPLVDPLPEGGHVLVICPPTGPLTTGLQSGPATANSPTTAPAAAPAQDAAAAAVPQSTPVPNEVVLFHALNRLRCRQTESMLLADPRFAVDKVFLAPSGDIRATAIDGYLLRKKASA